MIDKHGCKHYLKSMAFEACGSRRQGLVLLAMLSLLLVPVAVGAGVVAAVNAGRGGEVLDLRPLLIKGKINLVDFYSPFCPPCVKLAPVMEKLAERRPDLAIHKVNINRSEAKGIDWHSPLAQQYKIRQVPYFMIFNPQGKLVAQGSSAAEQVKSWLREAGLMQ